MVPERWALIGKGRLGGLPMVQVAREKYDPKARLTIWKLVRKGDAWYAIGQWISIGRYREHERPRKLSDSYTDQQLVKYAEQA